MVLVLSVMSVSMKKRKRNDVDKKKKKKAKKKEDDEENEGEQRVINSMEEFRESVYDLLLFGDADHDNDNNGETKPSIPRGRVTTYGDIAGHLGSRKVARHVGWALNALKQDQPAEDDDDNAVPWWRVVNSKGEVSFRPSDRDSRGMSLQMRRLQQEGVVFADVGGGVKKIKDFDKLLWNF